MIPKCKLWNVRTEDGSFKRQVWTITRKMCIIITRMDYPSTWGKRLIISVAKGV